jgi:NADPH:quinone reductase-like Zn-dependent oxidoreductase
MANAAKLPAQMTAIAISEPGGPLVLKPEKRDLPQPGQGEILIRVKAAGVNRPDVKEAWAKQGAVPMVMSPKEFDAYLRKDIDKWADVVKKTGAKK